MSVECRMSVEEKDMLMSLGEFVIVYYVRRCFNSLEEEKNLSLHKKNIISCI